MLRKLFILILTVFIFYPVFTSAQDDTPQDVVVGGTAKCKLKGNVPFKSGFTDGNRLLILQSEEFSNGSIILQRIFENEDILIDVKALALFGLINDVNSFLSGEVLSFENIDSDFTLTQQNKNKDTKLDISNVLEDGTKGKLVGKIKLSSVENNLAGGNVLLDYKSTIVKLEENEEVNTMDNGRVTIRCKFKDVPLVIKEP